MSSTPPYADRFDNSTAAGLTQDQAYAMVDAISESEELAMTAAAYELPDGTWAFEAMCDGEPDLALFAQLSQKHLGGAVSLMKERVDMSVDWVAQSQQNLAPVSAGGFFIHGTHDTHAIPSGAKPILIDAAQAFGTGHHETTTGCLEAIEQVLRTHSPKAAIDVGTGTGVLAIALAKKLRRPVIATDIDPVAVRTARTNAKTNSVGRFVRPFVANGVDHARITHEAPFDFIVANILAKPLMRIAPQVAEISNRRAHVILSGLLNKQAPRVIATYRDVGFKLKRKLVRGDWATLILKRG